MLNQGIQPRVPLWYPKEGVIQLYQLPQVADTDRDSSTLDHALDLIVQSGLKGLSLRNLAQKAGISPSLLNYRFGSRDALAERTFEHACQRNTELWNRRREAFVREQMHPDDIPAIAYGVVMDTTVAGYREAIAAWICQTEAARHGHYREIARRWHGECIGFWRDILSSAGLDPELAPGLSAALTSACRIGLLAGQAPVASAWLYDTVQRITDRLLRRPPLRSGDSPWRRQTEIAFLSRSPKADGAGTSTADRIIRAASQIIIRSGPDALTHRAIAEQAGVSLSSTTHHFASLDDIFLNTFSAIYDRISQETIDATVSLRAKSLEGLLDMLTPKLRDGAENRDQEVMAMDEIMLAAARRPETQPIAIGLFAMVGRTSTIMLDAIGDKRVETDRLDGQILRFILTGLQEQMATGDGDRDDAWFREQVARTARHFYC